MKTAQNDSLYTPLPVDEVFDGFEMAVADYHSGQSALEHAGAQLERTRAQLEYAQLSADEADVQLEVVVMAFNDSTPEAAEYPALMIELDLATEAMLAASDACEAAADSHKMALEQYQCELTSCEETFGLANALRVELSRSLDGLTSQPASNDPDYQADEVLSSLSDTAYRFFRNSA